MVRFPWAYDGVQRWEKVALGGNRNGVPRTRPKVVVVFFPTQLDDVMSDDACGKVIHVWPGTSI